MRHIALRRIFITLSLVLAVASAACAQGLRPHEPLNPAKAQSLPTAPLVIQGSGQSHSFVVELATTQKQRDTGLMHRNTLAPDRGMLFDFRREQVARFWMRNTFIPLDMLFIRAGGEITAIAANTTPHSDDPVGPMTPVQAVLELPGGTAARLGIKPGDIVRHEIFKNLAGN